MFFNSNQEDYEWMTAQNKRTVAVTSRIRFVANEALSSIPSGDAARYVIEERIHDLEGSVGMCERILSSPIPPTYTRHLSRVISLWTAFMPLSCVAVGLSPLSVVAVTAIAAYVMIGIDEVGMEIEDAFLLLPLQQLAAAAQNDVRDQILCTMPCVDEL